MLNTKLLLLNPPLGSLGFTKSNSPQAHSSNSTAGTKKNEVISILKRRNSEQNVVTSQEEAYDAYSEESGSQSFNEAFSEISDESSRNRRLKFDSDEDSDIDDYAVSFYLWISFFLKWV